MIKTVFKFLLISTLILLSFYFYKEDRTDNSWGNYTSLVFYSNEAAAKSVALLNKLKYKDILSKDDVTIGINNYKDIDEILNSEKDLLINKNDYRYDPYLSAIDSLFYNSKDGTTTVYVKLKKKDLVHIYQLHKALSDNFVVYKLGDTSFLRMILNFFSFTALLLLLGLGCKSRFFTSVVVAVVSILFLPPTNLNNYILVVILYFIVILIIESVSFSNRYIKRNNVGFIRIIFSILLFSLPTIMPSFLDLSTEVPYPVSDSSWVFDIDSLSKSFNSSSPNLSNYYTHFAYQKSFIYGREYLFPEENEEVFMEDFVREDYYLVSKQERMMIFDLNFLKTFMEYCSTTSLGKFYLDFEKPFIVKSDTLLGLYIKEKEYVQIGLLAVTMFLSSLFFKKRG
ncbi:MAG: hypothetical protein B6229_01215 [Spirochaetaceae bacterium 4572_7]|nr:MAG: hypothetical protein B6229_01215 [Spirochaetaceae bacterium 4572_7]